MYEPLIEKRINYVKEWEKTILYRYFNKKQPSESWKIQLRRIYNRDLYCWEIKYS